MNSAIRRRPPFVNIKYPSGEFAFISAFSLLVTFCCGNASAQETADDLSQKLANPLANLISVPIQSNFDFGAGADGNGFAYTMNIQPVIPFALNDDWNLITRTIIPVGYRDYLPGGDVGGLGDITASFFLSPKDPGPGGLIWGAGPVFLLPTATDESLGAEKFGIGPTAVGLVQQGPWTVGALGNHIWSVAGSESRADVSASLLQPFVSYNFGHGTSASLSVDSTYDWTNDQWTVPINLGVTQVFQIGTQAMSFQIGGKYYADAPPGGPEWGIRTTLTFLFPK
ncbi:transporter [Shinella sp.]|uniref:transporter n=1 Tax=Shinella sp. TaxID=1870904 RepID=UPI0040355DC7